MKTAYPIILTPAQRGYVVTVPDLEIHTEGETLADAISMAEDAIGLWGVTAQDLGREIPPPSAQLPACGDGEVAAFAVVDFAEAYQRLATHPDPFYSAENLSHLRLAIADLDAGHGKPYDLIAAQQEPVEECVPYDPNENW